MVVVMLRLQASDHVSTENRTHILTHETGHGSPVLHGVVHGLVIVVDVGRVVAVVVAGPGGGAALVVPPWDH